MEEKIDTTTFTTKKVRGRTRILEVRSSDIDAAAQLLRALREFTPSEIGPPGWLSRVEEPEESRFVLYVEGEMERGERIQSWMFITKMTPEGEIIDSIFVNGVSLEKSWKIGKDFASEDLDEAFLEYYERFESRLNETQRLIIYSKKEVRDE